MCTSEHPFASLTLMSINSPDRSVLFLFFKKKKLDNALLNIIYQKKKNVMYWETELLFVTARVLCNTLTTKNCRPILL